ncbi:hypothetical protein PC9H_007767 [Pleurotus ostreatus]|uniref:CigA protein n=1 Tax=Pleurotus ostreatus TaxID=5322 RepID=A0A8H6ZVI4_PLEOS|nr:uncharacterized protein PC9H_007767 [Pleurotus ostreatus]KAF7428543.1 hypothetical protein PC9H_007767 [Pleurotus ostreatus]
MIPFKLANQHREVGSPSVNLEKGRYRMRGPMPSTPTRSGSSSTGDAGQPIRRKRSQSTQNMAMSTCMATIVVLLVAACLTSFGFAYYLFTTRWDQATLSDAYTPANRLASTPPHSPLLPLQVVQFEPEASDLDAYTTRSDPHEKFLSYLPHSGYHNQRIALENALILARLLNRTLLLPPARLGKRVIHYMRYDLLRRALGLQGKEGLEHCARTFRFTPPECYGYFDYTLVPWDWLVNFTAIRNSQQLLQRWNMTHAWLSDNLGINVGHPDVYGDGKDVYTLTDTDPYQYVFLDTDMSMSEANKKSTKYKESIRIDALARDTSDKRLLQLGTLFGSARLRLRPSTLKLRSDIRKSMIPTIPQIEQVSNEIKRHLLTLSQEMGIDDYIGAHIRLGDGKFLEQSKSNIRTICHDMVRLVLGFTDDDDEDGLQTFLADLHNFHETRNELTTPKTNGQAGKLQCWLPKYTSQRFAPLNTPIFVSTDAQNPRQDTVISYLLQTFPCTFFLNDFIPTSQEHAPPLVTINDTLNLVSGYDGTPLRDHLLPFVDAIVVGKAWKAVGTEGSTFSRFILDVLWRVYHGLEIVQRG